MGELAIMLSDVGEGVAEAELIEWRVQVGDVVEEDQLLAVVMTDKAAVEIPSSALGRVVSLHAGVGDIIPVGSELLTLEVQGEGNAAGRGGATEAAAAAPQRAAREQTREQTRHSSAAARHNTAETTVSAKTRSGSESEPGQGGAAGNTPGGSGADASGRQHKQAATSRPKPLASPSVRQRAREAGIDLQQLHGSGPAGRITHDDIDNHSEQAAEGSGRRTADTSITETRVIGLRRKIADKMSLAKSRIPHITIVEEVDISHLEALREELNDKYSDSRPKLTLLPFVMKAIVEAVRDQADINAHYDDETETITQYGGVHIGIATQTAMGLVVPVVRHCEVNNLWDNAGEISRLATAAREGSASREDLGGSTITITSLGPLGAIATTPIINHPEVAIVGINKIAVRPHWDGQQFVPRKKMNISCSFDHRIIDGWVAASWVQKLATLLENPAMLFVES